jgi:hypothetical protein
MRTVLSFAPKQVVNVEPSACWWTRTYAGLLRFGTVFSILWLRGVTLSLVVRGDS